MSESGLLHLCLLVLMSIALGSAGALANTHLKSQDQPQATPGERHV